MLNPSFTHQEWPPREPIVTLAEAKSHLKIFGDTSIDDMIQLHLDAATEKVAGHVGYRISKSQITDYFTDYNKFFILSEPAIDDTSIMVKYYDENNDEQAFTDFSVDPSSKQPRLIMGEFNVPTSRDFENRWKVEYLTDPTKERGFHSYGRLKIAVLMITEAYLNAQNTHTEPSIIQRSLYNLTQTAGL